MAKRFTDTDKWKKSFLRGLKAPYKLLWIYILDECDHAGIWHVEIDIAQIKIGEKLKLDTAIESFGGRIIDLGEKWFIPDFIEFQYGELNPQNRAHNSVINILRKYDLLTEELKIKLLESPLQGAMDKDMDKDKVKEQDKVKEKPREVKKSIPGIEDFLAYAKSLKQYQPELDQAIEAKYNQWVADGWKDGYGKPIKVWQTKLQNTMLYMPGVSVQKKASNQESINDARTGAAKLLGI